MRTLHWVDTPDQLAEISEKLLDFESVAFDAEMDSYFVYHTKLCLVQISAGTMDVLVDPLALEDLTPLNCVTQNSEIRKVFHAGENDVPFFRDRGVEFENLFDTHIAAKLLDSPSKGLGGLVEHYFEVVLAKEHQRSDWRLRPLPEEQVEYARQDTLYLNQLADLMAEEMEQGELETESSQAFRALESFHVAKKEWDPEGWARIKGSKELGGIQRAVLSELFAWRDRLAQKRDLALFRVASNASLISLSRKKFRSGSDLAGWAKSATLKRHADELVEVMERGRQGGPIDYPDQGKKKYGGLSAEQEALFQRLRQWRNEESEKREVSPERVLSNRQLKRIVKKQPENLDSMKGIQGLEPWRVEEFGETVLEMLES